jgi:prepilin-type N-terminal cleavage/methylation domain-containing protein
MILIRDHKQVAVSSDKGFSLVEILVSAIVIGIAITAVVAVTRKSREIDITYQHSRRARGIIDSCFESSPYQYQNYANLPTVTDAPVSLDPRYSNLNGYLNIDVAEPPPVAAKSTPVTYKIVTATVKWTEPEGPDSVRISKWVTQLQ